MGQLRFPHSKIIKTPSQARRTLAYVLNNWRKHKQDELWGAQTWAFDPFSTGIHFPHWSERVDRTFVWDDGEPYDPLVVYSPRTWLLSEGWKGSKCGSCARGTGLERQLDTLWCYSCCPKRASSSARASSM
ncbi:MAG: hypothetical protein AB7O24_22205, partial [Kofleriaceae bacterium]